MKVIETTVKSLPVEWCQPHVDVPSSWAKWSSTIQHHRQQYPGKLHGLDPRLKESHSLFCLLTRVTIVLQSILCDRRIWFAFRWGFPKLMFQDTNACQVDLCRNVQESELEVDTVTQRYTYFLRERKCQFWNLVFRVFASFYAAVWHQNKWNMQLWRRWCQQTDVYQRRCVKKESSIHSLTMERTSLDQSHVPQTSA